jgi:hypothetical protein
MYVFSAVDGSLENQLRYAFVVEQFSRAVFYSKMYAKQIAIALAKSFLSLSLYGSTALWTMAAFSVS